MKRRTFLQLLLLLPFARWGRTVTATSAVASANGQFVFDGVNGLTFTTDKKLHKIFLPLVRR